jgi:serine/threonine-protein kinase
MKVLSKEPSARYRTADQLGHILANLLKKISSSEAVDTQTQPKPAQAPVIENGYPAPPAITHEDYSPAPRQTVDWKLVWLELLTLLLVGGLIPFWLFIWFKLSLVIQ